MRIDHTNKGMNIISVFKMNLSLFVTIVLTDDNVPELCDHNIKELSLAEGSLPILNPTAHFTTQTSKLSKP